MTIGEEIGASAGRFGVGEGGGNLTGVVFGWGEAILGCESDVDGPGCVAAPCSFASLLRRI